MSHDHHAVVIPAPGPEFVPHEVPHHFSTPVQEFQAGKLGFWLFLATEILLFGGLFAAYFYYHEVYPETFRVGGQQLDWKLGALNTSVLLLSSWTMAMGVRSAQTQPEEEDDDVPGADRARRGDLHGASSTSSTAPRTITG